MNWEERRKRRELRSQLEQDSFRIANPLEYGALKFILDKENNTYPTQHNNDVLNHLEEDLRMLIPGYESIDIARAILNSLNHRGLLGSCCDVHFNNLPNESIRGYRIPDNSVKTLIRG